MKLIISGISGKMGRYVYEIARASEGIEVICGVDRCDAGIFSCPVYPDFAAVRERADVVVDFSRPDLLEGILGYAERVRAGVVLATTGYDEAQTERIGRAAERIPVFRSANLSIGVNLLLDLVKRAEQFLGSDYDVEIIEKHHNQKADAPSGTALMLADAVSAGASEPFRYVYGREGATGKRGARELGIHAVRGGTIVGEHDVLFAGTDEVIAFSHSAGSKAVFAKGAVRAAKYLAGKPAGLYDMQDALGLK